METEHTILLQPTEIEKIEKFRRSKRTAVLTILFTDIVGFTQFTEDAGESTSSKFRHIHDELFIQTVTKDSAGEIVKQIGDSFLAVFAEPSTAVVRALEFQKRIDENKERLTYKDYTLTVRIGIHLGQVSIEDAIQPDIFGRHVNRASRIESIAKGSQVLTSLSVWENATGWVKDTTEIVSCPCGKARLKGISKPVEIYEFYYKEVGSQGIPEKIRKQRNKRKYTIVAYSSFTLVLLLLVCYYTGLWDSFRAGEEVEAFSDRIDSLFLPDIFISHDDREVYQYWEAMKQENNLSSSIIDPIPDSMLHELNDRILETLISALYPSNIILTNKDIDEAFIKKGKAPPEQTRRGVNFFERLVVRQVFI